MVRDTDGTPVTPAQAKSIIADHWTVPDQVRQLLPTSPLVGDLGHADLAVLEATGADPHALLRCGQARLGRLIGTASHGQQDPRAGCPLAPGRPRVAAAV